MHAPEAVLGIGITVAARGLLVLLFLPFSALDKLLNFQQAVGQAQQALPSRGLARSLIAIGFCIEVLMSGAILTGIADRAAAVVLAAYCVATAILWKQFWKAADFRLRGASRGRDTFWDFLKNLALAGGFLMLASGGGANGVRTFLHAPLASSDPYRLTTSSGDSR